MADIVTSLFGLANPQQQIRDSKRQRDFSIAELYGQATVNTKAPVARQQAYINKQGAQGALAGMAVRGLGSLFGVQDPELKRASDLEAILKQTQQEVGGDPTQLYPLLQQRLADAGYAREAMQVGQVGAKEIQAVQLNQAKLLTEEAQLAKAQKVEKDKRYLVAGKNVYDVETGNWIASPQGTGEKSEEDILSTDKKISLLSDVYNDETKPIEQRNKAAKQFNQLTASKFQGTGSIPQLTLLGQGEASQPSAPNSGLAFEVLPGSKKEMEDLALEKKAVSAAANRLASASDMSETIDNALSLASPKTTGAAGKALSLLPGTAAYQLSSTLDTIKANIGFDKLQAMRDASPTGGALGQVAVQEINFLQATIAKIEQGLSDKDLKSNLTKVKESYSRLQKELFKTLPKTVENLKFDPNLSKLRGKARDSYITKIYQNDKEFQALPEEEQIQMLNEIAHLNEKNKAVIAGKVYQRPSDFTDEEWNEYINFTKKAKGVQ
jgi:hypothetical protein